MFIPVLVRLSKKQHYFGYGNVYSVFRRRKVKAKFFEIIRKVESGETVEISKGGNLVAKIIPSKSDPLFGFAPNVKVHGDLTKPLDLN